MKRPIPAVRFFSVVVMMALLASAALFARPGEAQEQSLAAADTCADGSYHVLIVYSDIGGPPTTLIDNLLAEPGIASVDLFDAFSGTPTVSQLQGYDIVVPFSNNNYNDPTALGNNLHSYQAGGGIVVGLNFNWYGPPFGMAGAWITTDSPYVSPGPTAFSDASLGTCTFAPLCAGVTSLNARFRHTLTLAGGATEAATWSDGKSLIAYKGRAVGINAYLGEHPKNWSGQFAKVIANAGRWLSPPACASPAKVWIGLANSDDVGIKFDLLATVYVNGAPVGSGELDSVPGGSSGFNNAILRTIPVNLTGGSVSVQSGDVLAVQISARNACVGSGHNSGRARLWYNGQPIDSGSGRDAGSRFDASVVGSPDDYFLRTSFTLNTAPGSSRTSVDVSAGVKCGPFQSFGTWSETIP